MAGKEETVSKTESRSKASRGDLLVIQGHQVGGATRTGEILEVMGAARSEHYRVRWEDGHETIVYPSSDARIVPAAAAGGSRARTRNR